ncbi:hypothetical protein BH23CHL7_BH23CHL7_05520 [soil metagenome]
MFQQQCGSLALALMMAVSVLTLSVEPAAEAHVEDYRAAATVQLTGSSSPKPCLDRAYELSGFRQTRVLNWSFQAKSTPAGLKRAAAAATIQRAFANIVNARNDCGRKDRSAPSASYLGTTGHGTSCTVMDGRNVVGFKRLPTMTLAQACMWVLGDSIVEVDIQINSRLPWATSLASCRKAYMLEAVVTHEVGHAFGLGHVSEARHGRLTMSTHNDGMCINTESRLGLGDLLALEALY